MSDLEKAVLVFFQECHLNCHLLFQFLKSCRIISYFVNWFVLKWDFALYYV